MIKYLAILLNLPLLQPSFHTCTRQSTPWRARGTDGRSLRSTPRNGREEAAQRGSWSFERARRNHPALSDDGTLPRVTQGPLWGELPSP